MSSAWIPYGAFWCSPFARWQGSLAHLHSVQFAAHSARRELARRSIPAEIFDLGVLGTTIPQRHAFYGVPWLLGMIGATSTGGPTISQACATSVRCLQTAAQAVADGSGQTVLVVTADRTSNSPHIYYPAPQASGGVGATENWVPDNFGLDPLIGKSMVETAENVARKHGISASEQHDVVLQRYAQYRDTEQAFFARFMTLPCEVPDARFAKTVATLGGDEGVIESTAEGLARLKPVLAGGTVTYGGQTHPADGHAAAIVTTRERARELSARPEIGIRLAGFGSARVAPGCMPEAPVPAARRALQQAGIGIGDLAAITSHNPFAINDIVFARETGVELAAMNAHGCSLIWGHPQAPTGLRSIIELIETLVQRGGGWGLFHGCAAGDTAMAAVIEVRED